ncbi:hypothetical protein FRC03_003537 [Tulasnella sp. 419]|nr:hypothetical protein FRC03_003537 [Tulasnella sp. 419]
MLQPSVLDAQSTMIPHWTTNQCPPGARGVFKSLKDSLEQTDWTHLGFKRSASRPPSSFRHNASTVITSSSAAYVLAIKHLSIARENGVRLTAQNFQSLALPRLRQHFHCVMSLPSVGRELR